MRGYPLSDYDYFTSPPVPPYDHPTKWVESKAESISDFRGKSTPTIEFQLGFCTNLKDDISGGQEDVTCESPISTLLQDMIGEDPSGIFPSSVNSLHFATVIWDYLSCFEGTLKMVGVYEAI